MKKRLHKLLSKIAWVCLLSAAFAVGGILPVLAEKTTEQKLEQTNETIGQLQEKSKEAKAKLDAAKKEEGTISRKLEELNAQLLEVRNELEDVEAKILKKNEEIETARQEADQMEETRVKSYEAMKVRIRFMYENSDSSMLDSFLGARSMSEFLNRIEYFSQVVAYDRQQLTNYENLLTDIQEKQTALAEQKAELLTLKQQQEQQSQKLTALVADTRKQLEIAGVETAEAKDALNDLNQKLDAQENYQAVLEAQLAYEEQLEAQKAAEDRARMEEIKRQEEELRKKREEEARRRAEEEERRRQEAEAGGETTDEGTEDETGAGLAATAEELELLACIIQCEAEGEPYIGKLAVGSVVLNRVESSSFPNTIMGVIYQDGQFSPVASGRMAARLAAGANSECRQAAQEVLNGNITVPYLYFRRDNGTIDGYVIAHHVFY
ncbi:MAG: cell wall hydrolase [bacterium]|nr:cell wall hydrolase [bacterium]MDY4099345.1 cell wall hydrolase [Lachnospiraceae bacterium]